MSFHNDGQIAHSPDAVRALLEPYGITSFEYTIATHGIENTTFLVTTDKERYALRVYRAGKKQASITQELAFTDLLHDKGLPVPQVYPTSSGQPIATVTYEKQQWQAILQPFITGVHPQTYTPLLLKQMSTAQARMHSLGTLFADAQTHHRTLTRLVETHFITRIDIDTIHSSDMRDFLQRAKDYDISIDPVLPYGYSHFDFDAGNILVDNDNGITGILDFDDIAFGPFAICLGYTLYDILEVTHDESLLREYVTRYNAERELTANERAWLPIAMLFRHYVISSLSVLNGHTQPAELQSYIALEKQLMQLEL